MPNYSTHRSKLSRLGESSWLRTSRERLTEEGQREADNEWSDWRISDVPKRELTGRQESLTRPDESRSAD